MALALSDKIVRELPLPATGNRIVYDVDPKGFGIRLTAGGSRSFVLNYRIGRRERRQTIGAFPTWSVRDARAEAKALKREIDRGNDPLAERDRARTAPTMMELCERYLTEHARPKKKASSAGEDERNIRLHVKPALGKLLVADIEPDDIARLHQQDDSIPGSARTGCVATVENVCARRGLGSSTGEQQSVSAGSTAIKERSRDRLVTAEELARIGDALTGHKGYWGGPAAIRLLALTGMRKSEVLSLRWADVDFERGAARLPDSKTGRENRAFRRRSLGGLVGIAARRR